MWIWKSLVWLYGTGRPGFLLSWQGKPLNLVSPESLPRHHHTEIYGEEAVSRYAEYPDETAYDCGFTSELSTLTVDGMTISGKDSTGNELFSHTYHYIGMEDVRGLYEYESDDANSGEFTYFYFAPDTPQETYHIEFRYGSDKEELDMYDTGRYAYWLPSGISTGYDQKMVEDCIQLFCAENLGG